VQILLKLLLLIVSSLLITSCEHEDGSPGDDAAFEALVVEYDFENNKYELIHENIYSLSKPRSLSSNVAKFFYKVNSNVDLDFEPAVHLNLIKTTDDLYVAKDISSLKSISSYKIYEDLYDMHKKLGILSYSVWPKKVVVDGVDGAKTHNAFHAAWRTSTYYLPFDPNDVPASLNPGVIAHEETHGLFATQVIKSNISEDLFKVNSALIKIIHKIEKPCVRELSCGDFLNRYKKTEEFARIKSLQIFSNQLDMMEYNHTILRAIDEGFADFAGYVFTEVPNYLSATLGFEIERETFNRVVRSVVGPPLPSTVELRAVVSKVKGEPLPTNITGSLRTYVDTISRSSSLMGVSYNMAGQVSSLLNLLAQNIDHSLRPDHISKEEYFFQSITKSLSKMNKVVSQKYTSEEISFNDFFTAILSADIITPDVCRILNENISGEISLKGCANE